MFKEYKNINGNSNVKCYEIGIDYISIQFYGTKMTYFYTYKNPGKNHVEKMKYLADKGVGLNRYINLNCRNNYDKERSH